MSDLSRHSSYSIRRLPKQKRTLPIYGEREDTGKWYHCWNCGFVCNIDRDRLATVSVGSGSGVVVKETTIYIDDVAVIVKYPDVTGGCPFCGSFNYR